VEQRSDHPCLGFAVHGSGQPVYDEDVARLSPLGHAHLNCLGRYAFTAQPTAEGSCFGQYWLCERT
jgi:hypothetical protein